MYLRIKGNEFTTSFLHEVAALTDHARLHVRNVHYDESSKMLTFSIQRFPIRKQRIFQGYDYNMSCPIDASIIIRNVIQYNVDNHISDSPDAEVTLLFGLIVKGNQLCLSSAEESSGVTEYMVIIEVSELDVEIRDTTEENHENKNIT